MGELRVHLIEDDLSEGSLECWIEDGLSAVEEYLGKHAAFDAFLDSED